MIKNKIFYKYENNDSKKNIYKKENNVSSNDNSINDNITKNNNNTINDQNSIKENNVVNENDIVVNYSCFCKKYFYFNEKIVYVLPCCHIIHQTCLNKYIIENQYNKLNNKNKNNNNFLYCPDCNNKIKYILTENKINSKIKYKKYQNDIKSIRLPNTGFINYMVLPLAMIKLTTFINKLILVSSDKDLLETIEYLLKVFNIKINIIDNTKNNPIIIKNNHVSWKNSLDEKSKLVIISNHSNYFDSIFLYYIFRCGFISSDTINKIDLGKIIAEKCKLLIFRRGVDLNMVEKIKIYLEEMKRIVIYPEGTISNQDSLLRFRTGAFYTDAPVCPVIIKTDPFIYDDDFKKLLFKITTQSEIAVNIQINDFFYPPFDDNKIEKVRNYMCKIGKLDKSRVSNRTIKN